MSVAELRRLVPPPSAPVAPGSLQEWAAVEQRLGLVFPADYKEYIATYGSGAFPGLLFVMNPMKRVSFTDHVTYYLHSLDGQLEATRGAFGGGEEYRGEARPFPLWPEPAGLFPWGWMGMDGASKLFWLTEGDPDRWPVVWGDPYEPRWFNGPYTTTMTSFLAGTLRGAYSTGGDMQPKPDSAGLFKFNDLDSGLD